MYSELKKLVSISVVLFVISGLFTIISCPLLFNYSYLLQTDFRPFFIICGYLIASVPILLIVIIALLKKIMEILRIMDSNLSERITELEKKSEAK